MFHEKNKNKNNHHKWFNYFPLWHPFLISIMLFVFKRCAFCQPLFLVILFIIANVFHYFIPVSRFRDILFYLVFFYFILKLPLWTLFSVFHCMQPSFKSFWNTMIFIIHWNPTPREREKERKWKVSPAALTLHLTTQFIEQKYIN